MKSLRIVALALLVLAPLAVALVVTGGGRGVLSADQALSSTQVLTTTQAATHEPVTAPQVMTLPIQW
jgi:hypothetical protein